MFGVIFFGLSVLSDSEVSHVALLMVRPYRTDAATQAANLANALPCEDDNEGIVDWFRVTKSIEKGSGSDAGRW
jgi:hypothetical protein